MEDNKYYVPELEEFCVGFEYEYLTKEDVWHKDVFGSEKPLDSEQMPFNLVKAILKRFPAEIRVKRLCGKDIESLGFVADRDLCYFRIPNDTRKIDLFYTGSKIITIRIDTTQVFDGKVKNKTELKKLMKMLGIL